MHKLYWKLLFAERGVLLLGSTLAVITAFAGIALLAVSGWFISAAALAGLSAAAAHAFNFFTPGAIVRGLSIARTAGRYGERLANHEATFRLIAQLRTEIFLRLASQQGVGALMNRHQSASQMLQDITNVEGIHLHALVPALTAWLSAIGFVLVSSLFVPTIALSAIPLFLLSLILLPLLYARAVLQPETDLHIGRSALWSRTSALFSSLRLLTLTQQLDSQGEQLRAVARETDDFELSALKRQQLLLLLAQLSGLLLLGTTLWLALEAYLAGSLHGAQIFMLLLLALGTNEVIAAANPSLGHLILGMRALKRLDQPSELKTASADERTFNPDQVHSLVAKDLCFQYANSSQPVFADLNLEISGTGLSWIAGVSGRGKTSLIRLFAGELVPDSGELSLNGCSENRLCYMPQQVQLLRSSLRHNLDLNQLHSDAEIWDALKAVELENWAESLPEGLDTWIGRGEWEPSGGEIKRLGLARLLLKQPKIVLLDEPFAGMDSALQRELLKNLRQRWAQSLVLIVSHDLDLRADNEPLIHL